MSTVIMNTATIERRDLAVIDRTAIRLGTVLVSWGRRRSNRRRELDARANYRAAFAERARTASAIARQQLLP